MTRKQSIILDPVDNAELVKSLQKEIDGLVLEQERIEEDLAWCRDQLSKEQQKELFEDNTE